MLHLDTKENVEYEDWIIRKNYVVRACKTFKIIKKNSLNRKLTQYLHSAVDI